MLLQHPRAAQAADVFVFTVEVVDGQHKAGHDVEEK
jgi:hypothetical protein